MRDQRCHRLSARGGASPAPSAGGACGRAPEVAAGTHRVQLLSREDCHLCHDAARTLARLGVAFDPIDIDQSAAHPPPPPPPPRPARGGGGGPLHGHDYGVAAAVEGTLDENAWVVDFGAVKAILRSLCEELDHRFPPRPATAA